MKRIVICLLATTVAFASLAEPAQAGRRARRRAAVITGVATGTAAGAAVVATRRRSTVVAAPVVVARPAPVVAAAARPARATTVVAALPDLTVSDMVVEENRQCITVANIGRASSPESIVRVEFRDLADGALAAATTLRVPPLAINQSVRFRVHALPPGRLQADALVDPEDRIAERDELNNNLVVEAEFLPPPVEPTSLPDVDVYLSAGGQTAETLPAGSDN